VIAIEERVHRLETAMAALADVFRVLVCGLEESPMAEPGGKPVADAARRAHYLLLVMESTHRTLWGTQTVQMPDDGSEDTT
jgi:hypothetical protein